MDFLSSDNLCGQNLLKITSRGSAIIAELLRLSTNVPHIFLRADSIKDPQKKKYIDLMFDFHYLHNPEEYEKNIGSNAHLLDLDHEFQENHSEILDRFYKLFESIWRYQADFSKFIDDVQCGFYIQHSLDDIILEMAGRQLLCEALYLYGTMLLLLEERIPGPVREKIMIAVYRYNDEGSLQHIDEVCKLCRSTGYLPGQTLKKPKNYPANYFSRFPPDADFVRLVIGCLQMDDIYLMNTSFPSPEHRSTRLSQQGSILFTVLYFAPDLLNNQYTTMRELSDRYFNDNWVISTYMGRTVDLTVEWAAYPAARTALENTINITFVRQLNDRNIVLTQKCLEELKVYLTKGVLQQDFLLDNMKAIMKCVRSCNVAIRWRLMHRRCRNETYLKIVRDGLSPHILVTLLLNTSQLEYLLKEILLQLIANKSVTWTEGTEAAAGKLTEISEYFTGEKALSRVKKDEKLMLWFSGLSSQVRTLDLEEEHSTSTGRRIQGLIAALEDVEQFESIDTNLQIKLFLHEIRDIFRHMIRTVNIKEELINIVDNVSDLSYAWESLSDYLNIFHERIRNDSSSVVLLRATFLKAASILDVPLIRITAIDSPDAVSVAEYYSKELVEFVRTVLEVIPVSVFEIMGSIEQIQTHKMIQIPSRIEAKCLKDYAQLDLRYELSKLTHQISIFTEGILVMEKTLLGVIQVEPRLILQEGLRRELVKQIATAMHETLTFHDINMNMNRNDMNIKMSLLAATLDGLKRSIEYLQDYIGIAGLKMFQEELARIINYNTEQEANPYLKKKIFDDASRFQCRAVPIPRFDSLPEHSSSSSSFSSSSSSSSSYNNNNNNYYYNNKLLKNPDVAVNFMGRIVNSLLTATSSTHTVYAPESSTWYAYLPPDNKSKCSSKNIKQEFIESCGKRTFALVQRSLGAAGLRGLDRLFAFRTVAEFNSFFKFNECVVSEHRAFLDQMRERLHPEQRIVSTASKLYISAISKLEKLMAPILLSLSTIGQGQLIRRQIAYSLQFGCQLDAHTLYQTLDTFNSSLMNDVTKHYREPVRNPYPSSENPLLFEAAALLQACGLEDPLEKIYVTTQTLDGLPVLLLFFLLSQLPKLEYDSAVGSLVRKKGGGKGGTLDPIDGIPLAAGLACLLKQMHPSLTSKLMSYLGQYVRTNIQLVFGDSDVADHRDKAPEIPPLVVNILIFLDQLCKFSSIPRSAVHAYVPPYIFDALQISSSGAK